MNVFTVQCTYVWLCMVHQNCAILIIIRYTHTYMTRLSRQFHYTSFIRSRACSGDLNRSVCSLLCWVCWLGYMCDE